MANITEEGTDKVPGCDYQIAGLSANLTCDQKRLLRDIDTLAGRNCMIDYWKDTQISGPHCAAVWDNYLCWEATRPNQTVYKPCSDIVPRLMIGSKNAVAFRTCSANATWVDGAWTNFSQCSKNINNLLENLPVSSIAPKGDPTIDEEYMARLLFKIYFFGSIISLVLLCLTLFIFIYFKTLHCSRISIHKNLVVSFIVRCIIVIIISEPFVTKQLQYRDVDWLCKTVTSLHQYSVIANIFWMFVEGLFLHNRVAVSVFNTEAPFPIFYAVGWGLPAVIVIVWVSCMINFNFNRCWNNNFKTPYKWIITVPILLALVINAVFLVNIIRILITKLRANNTVETDQVRKAVKATAVLFPLLGMTNVLFFIEPKQSGASQMAYRVTNAILQSSQGIFVSVIYCFMNSEVRAAVLKKWQRYKSQRMGSTRGRRRSSTGRSSTAFLTSSTVAELRKSSNPRLNLMVNNINQLPVSSKEYNQVPTQIWNSKL